MVQRELARLQESGLVTQTVLGNQKRYRANAEAPIFAELCGIAAKMLGPAETLRRALAAHAADIALALLYGSVAARRDTAHSDLHLQAAQWRAGSGARQAQPGRIRGGSGCR